MCQRHGTREAGVRGEADTHDCNELQAKVRDERPPAHISVVAHQRKARWEAHLMPRIPVEPGAEYGPKPEPEGKTRQRDIAWDKRASSSSHTLLNSPSPPVRARKKCTHNVRKVEPPDPRGS